MCARQHRGWLGGPVNGDLFEGKPIGDCQLDEQEEAAVVAVLKTLSGLDGGRISA